MYRIFKLILRRDYIHWHNVAGSGIARIRKDAEGNVYYYRYKITKVIDTLPATDGQRIIWLTCLPSKYLEKNDGSEETK